MFFNVRVYLIRQVALLTDCIRVLADLIILVDSIGIIEYLKANLFIPYTLGALRIYE